MKVAVVGSGVSGLTAAYILGKSGHDVTIFERAPVLGMDQQGVTLSDNVRLDSPPRTINAKYYPTLLQLYAEAGIEVEPFSWDLSCSVFGDHARAQVVTRTVLGRAVPHLFRGPGLMPSGCMSSWRISRDAVKLYSLLGKDLADPSVQHMTFGDYMASRGPWSEEYLTSCLLASIATWCTCSYQSVMEYPAGWSACIAGLGCCSMALNMLYLQLPTGFSPGHAAWRCMHSCHDVMVMDSGMQHYA